MSITAKELAQKLGLSQTAVSMALNHRPGVSEETRRTILEAAEKYGYDFTRISAKNRHRGHIYFIRCQVSNAILSYTAIFDEILDGAMQECRSQNAQIKVEHLFVNRENLNAQISDLRVSDCMGIILLGTEIKAHIVQEFMSLHVPLVVVDSYLESANCTCILINNIQGAYLAADYLIKRGSGQPGYLKSNVPLQNFNERQEGFRRALRENGMSFTRSIVHTLPPTIEGATAEMLEILDRGDPLASCYFAENDLLAIGTIKAFQLRGYQIPQEIAVVGFDNISEGNVVSPALTTISVPRTYMGRLAARLVLSMLEEPFPYHIKVEVSTRLIKRDSA